MPRLPGQYSILAIPGNPGRFFDTYDFKSLNPHFFLPGLPGLPGQFSIIAKLGRFLDTMTSGVLTCFFSAWVAWVGSYFCNKKCAWVAWVGSYFCNDNVPGLPGLGAIFAIKNVPGLPGLGAIFATIMCLGCLGWELFLQ